MSNKKVAKSKKKLSFKDKLMQVHRFYGVEIQYLEPKQSTVQYVMETEYLGYEGSIYSYRLFRERFYVNGKQLTGIMEVLAEKCASIIYPLVLKVTFSGVIVGLDHFEKISSRWKALLPKLEQAYTGKVAQHYLKSVSQSLADETIFIKKLNRDVIYALIIPRLYAMAETSLIKENCEFVLSHYAYKEGITFTGKQEIGKYPNKNNHIDVGYEGTLDESETVFKDKITKGRLQLKYYLDNENISMIGLRGFCEFNNPTYNKIEYKITRLKERELTKKP